MASKDELRPGKPRARFNSITSIWFGIIVGVFQAYLIVRNVRRFVSFAELSWPYQRTPFIELNAYIGLTGVAVLLLPFFLASCILQVGNSSNDNRALGRHLGTRDEWAVHLLPSMLYQGTRSFFRTIWTHSGPTSSIVHVISSFCILLPQTLMEATLIRYQFLPPECIWKTDLDMLMVQKDRNEVLGILGTQHGDAVETSQFIKSSSSTYLSPELIRPEYINYAVALIIFSVRYANAFWESNKTFTLLFSIQLMVNTLHSLVSFSAFSVLYKLHVYGPTRILMTELPLLLDSHVTLLLYIISISILLISSGVIYHYGYLKIGSFVKEKARAAYVTNGVDDQGNYGVGWAYFPHCSALAVLLSLAASQSPLVHDATLVYRASLDNCMLADIISSAVHILLWMALWLNLTAKRDWNFHIDVNIGKLRVKGLESLRLTADIALALPESPNTPHTPVSSAMLVVSDSQAFAVTDVNSKKSILGVLMRNAQIKRDGESDERIYWPRRSPVAGTQNSLEDDEQPWLHENNKETTTTSPSRNKVTFNDELPSPSRKYASVPLPNRGGLKKNCRDRSYNQLSQTDADEGDYAMLRGGKNVSNKHRLPAPADTDYEEHQELLALVANGPPENHQMMSLQSGNNPMNSGIRETTNPAQGTPRSVQSTDSGYNGRSGSVTRSDSRSTASSASPPDRTASASDSSSGVHSLYGGNNNSGRNSTAQAHPSSSSSDTNCHCDNPHCFEKQQPQQQQQQQTTTVVYGHISRRNSIKLKSPTHPIYETSPAHGKNINSIYESRVVPVPAVLPPPSHQAHHPENPYGERPKLVNLTLHSNPTSSSSSPALKNENASANNSIIVNQWHQHNNRSSIADRSNATITSTDVLVVKSTNETESSYPKEKIYAGLPSSAAMTNGTASPPVSSNGSATIIEKNENGVMIRRKPSLTRPKTTDMSSVIQSTPYGRCTNMKLSSFVDQAMPPIPPPLPPLSFVTSLNSQHGTIPPPSSANGGLRSLQSSASFRQSPRINMNPHHSPASSNYMSPQYPRHSTIPNHPGIHANGDILSSFHHSPHCSPNPNNVNTYPMIQQTSSSIYGHSQAPVLQHKN